MYTNKLFYERCGTMKKNYRVDRRIDSTNTSVLVIKYNNHNSNDRQKNKTRLISTYFSEFNELLPF